MGLMELSGYPLQAYSCLRKGLRGRLGADPWQRFI